MLLACDDLSALARGGKDGLLVERLDGADVDDTHADALRGERFRRLERFGDHETGRGNGDVRAGAEHLRFADLKGKALFLVDHRHGGAPEADVYGSLVLIGRLDSGARFHIVRRGENDHAGDRAHKRKVLAALVGSAVLPDGDTAVGGADLDVQMRVADGVSHLLKGAARREHRKRRAERHEAHCGQTGAHADKVRLGNAAVDVAVGVCLFEYRRFGGAGKVGIENKDIVMLGGERRYRVAVAVTGSNFYNVRHHSASSSRRAFSSSSIAAWYCSSLGALPCQPT